MVKSVLIRYSLFKIARRGRRGVTPQLRDSCLARSFLRSATSPLLPFGTLHLVQCSVRRFSEDISGCVAARKLLFIHVSETSESVRLCCTPFNKPGYPASTAGWGRSTTRFCCQGYPKRASYARYGKAHQACCLPRLRGYPAQLFFLYTTR